MMEFVECTSCHLASSGRLVYMWISYAVSGLFIYLFIYFIMWASSSSSAYFPTFKCGRCVLWDVSIELSLELPPLTILLSDKSLLMLSNHLRFGIPLLLFPGTSIIITLRILLLFSIHAPHHFNLLSCTLLDISPTFVVHLVFSFLILSSLVTPLTHRNILISVTSNFFSCAFLTAHVSALYITAGLTTFMYTSPWFSNVFFGRTESPIPSSSCSILIVFYASSPHPSLRFLPMSLLDTNMYSLFPK